MNNKINQYKGVAFVIDDTVTEKYVYYGTYEKYPGNVYDWAKYMIEDTKAKYFRCNLKRFEELIIEETGVCFPWSEVLESEKTEYIVVVRLYKDYSTGIYVYEGNEIKFENQISK